MRIRFLLAALGAASIILAGPMSLQRLGAAEGPANALSCTFETGTSVTYSLGAFQSSEAKPLAFQISAIDFERQQAALRTEKGGKGDLKIVRAVGANHFLEVVSEGFLNITTVYDLDPKQKVHPAVHSRHLGLLGEPIIAQYYGLCTESQ